MARELDVEVGQAGALEEVTQSIEKVVLEAGLLESLGTCWAWPIIVEGNARVVAAEDVLRAAELRVVLDAIVRLLRKVLRRQPTAPADVDMRTWSRAPACAASVAGG